MPTLHAPASPRIVEEASLWLVELNEGNADLATRKAFAAWLRTSPEHIRVFLKVSATWEDAALIGKNEGAGERLVELALAGDNVVSLGTVSPLVQAESNASGRSFRALAIAASLLIALAVPALWFYVWSGTYSTDVGEQRSIALSDGSTVDLNTQSRIRVRFTGAQRRIDLLEGQALFQVAPDASRPFVVRSDATDVRAVGTQFDVYRTRDGTVVTVLEGRVAVLDSRAQARVPDNQSHAPSGAGGPAADGAIFVAAGEQVTVGDRAPVHAAPAEAQSDMPWRQRRLMFRATPLARVVEEYNRYHERQLRIRDAELEQVPISGAFSATDSASLIAFLREQPNIAIRERGSEIDLVLR